MNTMNFSTGVKTFSVNDGAVEISYNPTDPLFAERVYDAFQSLSDKYEAGKDKTLTITRPFSTMSASATGKSTRLWMACSVKT